MSQTWLKDLEDKVHAASKALRALREENDGLKARIKDLEDAEAKDGANGTDGRRELGRKSATRSAAASRSSPITWRSCWARVESAERARS